MVLMNPEVTWASEALNTYEEGCLSIPEIYYEVERPAEVIKSFDTSKDRRRIILFLGDGMSTHNPMTDADRTALARQMTERRIGFYPVPLGVQVDPKTLHVGLVDLVRNDLDGFLAGFHIENGHRVGRI